MYKLCYDPMTGKVVTIKLLSANSEQHVFIRICDSPEFTAFLIWNKVQKTPLDLNSTIEVVRPVPPRDLAKELTDLQLKVTALESKAK